MSSLKRLLRPETSVGIPVEEDPLSDFRKLLWVIWDHLKLPAPTPVQYEIAVWLQHGPERSITEAFRGVGKSWITAAFAIWLLYMNPQIRIMVVSASKERADNFTTFCMQLLMTLPELAHLRPNAESRNSRVSFDVGMAEPDQAPSLRSIGVTGQLTGGRADIIIPDDVEVPNNSSTQFMRDILANRIKEFDAILKPGGIIRFLGTPQTEMTIYNLLQNRGYSCRIWPARYPDVDVIDKLGHRLAPSVARKVTEDPSVIGTPTDPDRFDDEDLRKREASYGRSGFALQFQLDTSLSDANLYPLKVSDLTIMDTNIDLAPESVVWANDKELHLNELNCVAMDGDRFHKPMQIVGKYIPYEGSVMFIDPAGRGADETSYAVVKQLNGFLYLTDFGAIPGNYEPVALKKAADLAKLHKVNLILYESNFGDGMYGALLTPVLKKIYPVTIEEVRHTTQKEIRIIDTLEPVMNQHRLIVDRKAIERDFESTQDMPQEQGLKYQFIYQLTRVTKLRGALAHDDRLDAVAGAVRYWVDALAQDSDDKMDQHKQSQWDKELAQFHNALEMGLAVATGHVGHGNGDSVSGWIDI